MKDSKSAFNEIRDIGVIWVMDEAIKLGYYNGNPDWVNLGQGEPETGEMEGAPPRITNIQFEAIDNKYGPINGMMLLREVIANYYNDLYRKDKKSKYTAENVSVAMGGRLALSRIFSILGKVRLGFKVPEYPAYQDLIGFQQGRITGVYLPSKKEDNYAILPNKWSKQIQGENLDAFIMSNPCNPTGHVIKGEELEAYLKIATIQHCTLIIDEVYSHFIYSDGLITASPISMAEFVEDVNSDQVLIVDALTKSFRYPGWRLAWTLGPKDVIEDLGRAESGMDGGRSLSFQRADVALCEQMSDCCET